MRRRALEQELLNREVSALSTRSTESLKQELHRIRASEHLDTLDIAESLCRLDYKRHITRACCEEYEK